ncbi:MAG: hypothetical protein VKL20_05065 [Synechocystis sp.]|nr:hypothetical protein [Synechocystis sp.]
MAKNTINLEIPFELLANAIGDLDLPQKHQLLERLEQQIFEAEELTYDDLPETLAELQAVRREYEAGDYITLDQYLGISGKP